MAGTTRRLRLATAAVAAGESQLSRHLTQKEKHSDIFVCLFVCFIFSRVLLPASFSAWQLLAGSCTACVTCRVKKHLTGPTLGLLYTLIVVPLACRAD